MRRLTTSNVELYILPDNKSKEFSSPLDLITTLNEAGRKTLLKSYSTKF